MSEEAARGRVAALVSADAVHRLETFIDCLRRWGGTHNLIGANEFPRLWERHVLDSLTLLPHARGPLIDLGSGAGFPGLVLALADPRMEVTLVEANRRKAAFLTHAIGATRARATVRPVRIEAHAARPHATVTARALAPLGALLTLAHRFFGSETVGLFLKGRDAGTEVEAARATHAFDAELLPSLVGDGHLVRVTNLAPV